jgi:hypothetical protein
MAAPVLPPLSEWQSFYTIMGAASATLTGLMFVVITLGAQTRATREPEAVNAYGTPTVTHFGVVLLIAALLTTPHHTNGSLSACIVACGVGGVVYVIRVTRRARRQKAYEPELSDWIWHSGLPFGTYAGLLTAGILLRRSPEPALDIIAAAALALLYIGIHNAWDAAVWMAHHRQQSR